MGNELVETQKGRREGGEDGVSAVVRMKVEWLWGVLYVGIR